MNLRTPIIIGVGQFCERLDSPDYQAMSATDIAANACRRALEDSTAVGRIEEAIDCIATTRTFEDSIPTRAQPFGKSNNFPRSIARRLGIKPRDAIWDRAGGDTPQRLVNEFAEKIAAGKAEVVLIAGAENISTARALVKAGKTADWSEQVEGAVEDRGMGLKGMFSRYTRLHKLATAPVSHGLIENARRHRLQMNRADYARDMARMLAPFSAVASNNPYSASAVPPYSEDELLAVSERNRMIADPYPQRMVARDQVNQGAAVLLTSVGQAQALGIPQEKWVFLHGYCDLAEQELLDRADLGSSPAAQLACQAALEAADVSADAMRFFDFYSCFPVAVSNAACDGLGLAPNDARGLTVTGGLPFFGGPGNNYSMHAIATMVERLRAAPGEFGFIGANGGILSKYSAAVYSTRPISWKVCDSTVLQQRINKLPVVEICLRPEGAGTIETYTIVYEKGLPAYGIVVGRLDTTGARFLAVTHEADRETVEEMLQESIFGKPILVTTTAHGNRFAFSSQRLSELLPKRKPAFRERYEYCQVDRHDHLLEVTINRPEARNSLHPPANDELAEIFDAYEADSDLWVAIIHGAGDEAFSAGNDLKYSASGKPMWVPLSGFGGLTNRERSKPVIAAVSGYAMGGGLEMCLACDMIVADETAVFALSETRVGLFAGAGGVIRLPRQIPPKIATELILTGRKFSAQDAMRWGLISQVAPAGQAMLAARALAKEILECSPTSVRISLKAMRGADAWASAHDAVCQQDPKLIDELITSDDFFEGPAAFAHKRKPHWKNR